MKILTHSETQILLKAFLFTFIDWCEQNNLQYTLAYGSLLGAVRHKGFIPWDDDVDIWMPREDYEKIKSLRLPECCYLLMETDFSSPWRFTKICLRNTVFQEFILGENNPQGYGLFIDIFPLDKIPENKLLQKGFRFLYRRIFNIYKTAYGSNKKGAIFRFLIEPFRLIKPNFYISLLKKLRNSVSDQSPFFCSLSAYHSSRIAYHNSEIFPLKFLDFENKRVAVPNKYENVLAKEFGNWRTPVQSKEKHGIAYLKTGLSINTLLKNIHL